MKKKKNDLFLTVRVYPEMMKELRKQAKREERTLSNYVRTLFARAIFPEPSENP